MALIEARASARIVRPTSGQLASGLRDLPERVVLGVREGHEPSDKEPVRIFLGTQPEQHRAERIFVWSIEQVRDPSRVYEIYLMKALRGFDQRGWTTGFTNYRFAIPHFAGRHGRAIYNDVDQIYLADPAELFDTPLGDYGFLAIAPKESSVMLIDCERMARVWPLGDAQRMSKGKVLAKALSEPGCWGPVAGEWNARDEDEFDPATAKCVHFTTLHTQPWGPVPSRFVYLPHPAGKVWHDLERSADHAGFQVFSREQPSAPYRALLASFRSGERARESASIGDRALEELRGAVQRDGVRTVLDYRLGIEGDGGVESLPGLDVTRFDPSIAGSAPEDSARFDAVVCYQGLNVLTDDDIPWVIDELFRQARQFVLASAGTADPRRWLNGARRYRDLGWWRQQFQVAADRYPNVRWVLLGPAQFPFSSTPAIVEGRNALGDSTRVWVLTDERPGNATQAVGLGDALGWEHERKELRFNRWAGLGNHILGATRLALDTARSSDLEPPWPDVVIAAGQRTAPIARWIGAQSRGRTRLVQLGRKGANVAECFDAVITPAHTRMWPHHRRIETLGPLNSVSESRLRDAAERWPDLLAEEPEPRIVALIGGATPRYQFEEKIAARLGADLLRLAERSGGSVTVVTSRRTADESVATLQGTLGSAGTVVPWQAGRESPYLGYLAAADLLVVTGESESMLAEVASTGKPMYIYALPKRPPGLLTSWADRIVARAHSRPENNRGTTRPQQGLEYFCARLVSGGWVLPPRSIEAQHQALYRRGIARPFGDSLSVERHEPLRETEAVALELKALLASPR